MLPDMHAVSHAVHMTCEGEHDWAYSEFPHDLWTTFVLITSYVTPSSLHGFINGLHIGYQGEMTDERRHALTHI